MRTPFTAMLVLSALIFTTSARAADPRFEPPVPVAADATTDVGGSDYEPEAATDGNGTWVVAWHGKPDLQRFGLDEDVFFARSTDGGLTFSVQQALNNDAVTDNGGDSPFDAGPDDKKVSIAAGPNGRFIAVWERPLQGASTLGLLQMARSSDGGATWTNPVTLLTGTRDPVIATDGAGTWIVVWLQPTNTFYESDFHFSRSTDDGATFSPPQHLNTDWSTDTIFDVAPTIAWSGSVWIVGWQAWLLVGFPFPVPSAPLHPGVLYTRSTDGGVTWSATAGVDGTAVPAEFRAGPPRFAGDGTGGWVATWTVKNDATGDADVLVARSSDGGVTWSAPQTLNGTSTSAERRNSAARIAAGTPGTYVVTWVRGSDDVSYEVRTSTSTDGGATWSAAHAIYSAGINGIDPAQIFGSTLAHDPAGHWLAIWGTNDTNIASGTKGNDFDMVMSLGDHACGNGVLDSGETCDDGDRGSLDCCGRTCGFDPVDAVCAADADPCTLERCDGAGTCGHQLAPVGTRCAADADLCTFDRCDGAGACAHVFEPQNDCRVSTRPQSSKISFGTKGTPESQRLRWKWSRGELAYFAYLITGEDYALCLYDGSGLLMRADAPVSTCPNGKPCWNVRASSLLKYNDKDATPNGVIAALLTPGAHDKTKMSMTGKGANLGLPTMPLAIAPVTAQLVGTDHGCWTATYSTGIKRNDGSLFKATSD